MTFHPERYIGVAFVALVVLAITPPVMDWWAVVNLPPPVQAAIAQQFPDSRATRVQLRTDGGRTVYDIHTQQGCERYVVRVTPDGRVLQVAQQVGILDLPAFAYDQLGESCPPVCRIREVTAVTDGNGILRYEVGIVADGRLSQFVLGTGGQQTTSMADSGLASQAEADTSGWQEVSSVVQLLGLHR